MQPSRVMYCEGLLPHREEQLAAIITALTRRAPQKSDVEVTLVFPKMGTTGMLQSNVAICETLHHAEA